MQASVNPESYKHNAGLKNLVTSELNQVNGGQANVIKEVQTMVLNGELSLGDKKSDQTFSQADASNIAGQMCFMNCYYLTANRARVNAGLSPVSFRDAYIYMLVSSSLKRSGKSAFAERTSNAYLNKFESDGYKFEKGYDSDYVVPAKFKTKKEMMLADKSLLYHVKRGSGGDHSVTTVWDEERQDFLITDTYHSDLNGITYDEYVKKTAEPKWIVGYKLVK
ncbi:MAG: hypothetical protein AAF518_11890 [Spirochaetota bacterium]